MSKSNHPGSRKVKKIVENAWSEGVMLEAIDKIQSTTGLSIRKVAKDFGLKECTVRFRLNKLKNGEGLQKVGRKCASPTDQENRLAKCIGVLCKNGFSPSLKEIRNLVKEFIERNNITKHQFRENRPGAKWMRSFMKRNRLTLKKAEMISSCRFSNTSNPFIIYDFYGTLEKVLEEYPTLNADRVWNCDESGFPTDPSKGKVIAQKGQHALKQRPGTSRENITVLAVSNAAGRALDPLIIFKGKHMQSTWFGDKALPGTFYGKSENGWMDTEVFAEWCERFSSQITERPLLLLFEGHMTHVSLGVIKKALKDDIIIVKFPPHVTDVLQPLHVSCFGPLKRKWKILLKERVNLFAARSQLSEGDFVNHLCKIWRDGLKPDNIISGFASTGIYPVDRSKYPVHRLKKLKLLAYEKWKLSGEGLNWERLDEIFTETTAVQNTTTSSIILTTSTATTSITKPASSISMTSTIQPKTWEEMTEKEKQLEVLGPYPCKAPARFEWIPNGWKLAQIHVATTDNSSPNTSFQELFLEKIQAVGEKKKDKRSKVDFRGKIVSNEEVLQQLYEKEERKKETERRKEAANMRKIEKKLETTSRKRKAESDYEDSEDDELDDILSNVEDDDGNDDESSVNNHEEGDSDKENSVSTESIQFPSMDLREYHVTKKTWKWYACIFRGKCQNLFIGRVLQRFLTDSIEEGGYTAAIEVDCLKQKLGTADDILRENTIEKKDIGIAPVTNVIAGPLKPVLLENGKWKFPEYENATKLFHKLQKEDRQKTYNTFVATTFNKEK